ncbi:MAG: sucrase ferredoxin [Candidatus Nanopelagicales bacterium]
MTDDFRCGVMARARGDALPGTAAPARHWLLVQDLGPWPRRAFVDHPGDPVAGREIVARARESRTRPLFIRRPGRRDPRDPADRWAYVDSIAGAALWGHYRSLAEVAAGPWQAAAPLSEPLYLVCTHGRHDQCCAIAGRPVAGEFARLRPASTWECSHLGGDRFAGNVVVLPWGLTYGFVDADDVASIVAATERGEVYLPLLRGRSTDGPVVQAARIGVQRDLGLAGIDALTLTEVHATEPGRWRVSFSAGADAGDSAEAAGAWSVAVEQVRIADARATCAHDEPGPMRELQCGEVSVSRGPVSR